MGQIGEANAGVVLYSRNIHVIFTLYSRNIHMDGKISSRQGCATPHNLDEHQKLCNSIRECNNIHVHSIVSIIDGTCIKINCKLYPTKEIKTFSDYTPAEPSPVKNNIRHCVME
jgi:hypothetical protein